MTRSISQPGVSDVTLMVGGRTGSRIASSAVTRSRVPPPADRRPVIDLSAVTGTPNRPKMPVLAAERRGVDQRDHAGGRAPSTGVSQNALVPTPRERRSPHR